MSLLRGVISSSVRIPTARTSSRYVCPISTSAYRLAMDTTTNQTPLSTQTPPPLSNATSSSATTTTTTSSNQTQSQAQVQSNEGGRTKATSSSERSMSRNNLTRYEKRKLAKFERRRKYQMDKAKFYSLANTMIEDTHTNRLEEHYHNTIAPSMLYMTYDHDLIANPPPPAITKIKQWDENDPYSKNRPMRGPGSNEALIPNPKPTTGDNIPKIEHITVSMYVPELAERKRGGNQLFSVIMSLQAITGASEHQKYMHRNNQLQVRGKGIEILHSRAPSARHKVKLGKAMGAKVKLQGTPAYDFGDVLAEFVLPRLQNWQGIQLPNPKNIMSYNNIGNMSGSIDIRLPPEAMTFFPQIEVNRDAYPRNHPIVINIVTNARGEGSRDKARALASGLFRVPFVRSEELKERDSVNTSYMKSK